MVGYNFAGLTVHKFELFLAADNTQITECPVSTLQLTITAWLKVSSRWPFNVEIQ